MITAPSRSDDLPDRPFDGRTILAGFGVIGAFLASLAAWSLLAPIESAVVAPGVVGVMGNVKSVQHLEGGIVESILVGEGDHVKAGDILIRLETTARLAALNEVRAQYFEARATEARLIAERDELAAIEFPPELRSKAAAASVRQAIIGQEGIFESRRELLTEQRAIIARARSGLDDEIAGYEGQISAAEQQVALLDDELTGALALLERGLTDKPRVLELQRRRAELQGDLSDYRASVANARQRAEETQLRLAELRATTIGVAVEQLREARSLAYEMEQKVAAAADVLERSEIRSPIDGVVVGLKVHTLGGVIAAGETLLEIVPSGGDLIIEASVDPLDVDQVKVGLPATVRVSALNRRNQAEIDADVVTVSADRLTDPATGFAYYLAHVALRPESPGLRAVVLRPGMSAEVMIRTGARTPWQYLSAPILSAMHRALRER